MAASDVQEPISMQTIAHRVGLLFLPCDRHGPDVRSQRSCNSVDRSASHRRQRMEETPSRAIRPFAAPEPAIRTGDCLGVRDKLLHDKIHRSVAFTDTKRRINLIAESVLANMSIDKHATIRFTATPFAGIVAVAISA